VLTRHLKFNSIQAFSEGLTPTGACTLFRYAFLMCLSSLARISAKVDFAITQCRGVSGWLRISSMIVPST
jgi:hypothetical protein